MEKDKVFLDTSVLVTAVLSSAGGSFYILNSLKDRFEFFINEYVLEEAIRVLDDKFHQKEDYKNKLFLLIGLASIKIVLNPPAKQVKKLTRILNEKDCPILASAIKHCSYLITLDNDFLSREVAEFSLKKRLMILKPKDFIQIVRNPN